MHGRAQYDHLLFLSCFFLTFVRHGRGQLAFLVRDVGRLGGGGGPGVTFRGGTINAGDVHAPDGALCIYSLPWCHFMHRMARLTGKPRRPLFF